MVSDTAAPPAGQWPARSNSRCCQWVSAAAPGRFAAVTTITAIAPIVAIATLAAVAAIAAVAIGALSPIGARLLLRTNLQWHSEKDQEHA